MNAPSLAACAASRFFRAWVLEAAPPCSPTSSHEWRRFAAATRVCCFRGGQTPEQSGRAMLHNSGAFASSTACRCPPPARFRPREGGVASDQGNE